jgi:hypothetical protein
MASSHDTPWQNCPEHLIGPAILLGACRLHKFAAIIRYLGKYTFVLAGELNSQAAAARGVYDTPQQAYDAFFKWCIGRSTQEVTT